MSPVVFRRALSIRRSAWFSFLPGHRDAALVRRVRSLRPTLAARRRLNIGSSVSHSLRRIPSNLCHRRRMLPAISAASTAHLQGRTGFRGVPLLLALVARAKTVLEDYDRTNRYRRAVPQLLVLRLRRDLTLLLSPRIRIPLRPLLRTSTASMARLTTDIATGAWGRTLLLAGRLVELLTEPGYNPSTRD